MKIKALLLFLSAAVFFGLPARGQNNGADVEEAHKTDVVQTTESAQSPVIMEMQAEEADAPEVSASSPSPISSVAPDSPVAGARVIEGVDYTIALGGLAEFFRTKHAEFSGMADEWGLKLKADLDGKDEVANKLAALEESLNHKVYSDCLRYTQEIAAIRSDLTAERGKYKERKTQLVSGAQKSAADLKGMEKQELKQLADAFKNTDKNILSTAGQTAQVTKSVPVHFSPRPEVKDMPGYLRPINELLFWYWNAEQSLYDLISAHNAKIAARIEEDDKLKENAAALEKELADYNAKDPKAFKKQISDLKKQISQIDKERKAVVKSLQADGKELSKQVKSLGAELQSAYKERTARIAEEFSYLAGEL